jgi:hypothetical protein
VKGLFHIIKSQPIISVTIFFIAIDSPALVSLKTEVIHLFKNSGDMLIYSDIFIE